MPPRPDVVASYALRVPQAGVLPTASFRPRLAAAALAVQLTVPVIRVRRGLPPPSECALPGAQSGRRRDHSRRPPTPPDVPFGIRRFLSSVSGVSFVPLTIRLLVSGHLHGPRDFRPLLPSQALSRGFCPTSQRGSPLSARDRFGPSLQTGSYYGFC